jgi:alanine dehydrogenase
MNVGIPRETRVGEQRAALTPAGAKALVQEGHRVWIERGAGSRAGFEDATYQAAGATIAYTRDELFARGDLIAAVFPPDPAEYETLLHPGQTVMAFWMLPASGRADVLALQRCGVSVIGLEAIADAEGRAPVLESMSEIAGGLAITVGSCLLLNAFGGKGVLMAGVPGVPPAQVAILGGGVLGRSAARAAVGAGAQVTLLDARMEPLRAAVAETRGLATMLSTPSNLEKALSFADLMIGAVAVRGERAPLLVTRPMLALMKPKSVVLDLSIDMGGCFETSRPTSFPEPAFEVDGILHFCVPNLPAAAARSATVALTNALLPYLIDIGHGDLERAVAASGELRRGLYLYRGNCAQSGLGRALDLPGASMPWAMG